MTMTLKATFQVSVETQCSSWLQYSIGHHVYNVVYREIYVEIEFGSAAHHLVMHRALRGHMRPPLRIDDIFFGRW